MIYCFIGGLMPAGLYKLSKQLEQSEEVDQVANEIQGLVLLR
jgi:hypothetical protein